MTQGHHWMFVFVLIRFLLACILHLPIELMLLSIPIEMEGLFMSVTLKDNETNWTIEGPTYL